MAEILSERLLEGFYLSDGLYLWQSQALFTLESGQTYTVNWDGTEYNCTASNMTLGELSGVGLGNAAIVGIGENTGEPFIFAYIPDMGFNACYTAEEDDSHTVSIALKETTEEETKSGLVLKDRAGNDIIYEGVTTLQIPTSGGGTMNFSNAVPVEKTVEADFSSGDMVIEPDEGTVLSKANVKKPGTLIPAHILKDVNIAGVVGEVETGGTGIAESKAINFYDIYGNIIYSYTRAEAALLTELPEAPELEGFTFTAWYSYSYTVTLESLKAVPDFLDVVPVYKKDGSSVCIIVFDVWTGAQIDLQLNQTAAYLSVDFGDGGGWESPTATGQIVVSHTYETAGTYVVAIKTTNTVNTRIGFKSTTQKNFLGNTYSTSETIISTGTNACVRSFFNFAGIYLGQYALSNLPKMKIAETSHCSGYCFYNCHSLETLILATSSLANYAVYNCYNLKRLTVQGISSYQFVGLHSLTDFKYKGTSTVYSLPQAGNMRYVFTKTTVPTLSGATIPSTYNGHEFYVPDDAVASWKASWSARANYIKPISEYPDY